MTNFRPSDDLLRAMRVLVREHNCTRVEIQGHAEHMALDGEAKLSGPYSVLYLPDLGWTAKDDLKSHSWVDARIIANDGEVAD